MGRRLAWAARGNIDCGGEKKVSPARRAGLSRHCTACWRGQVQSLYGLDPSGHHPANYRRHRASGTPRFGLCGREIIGQQEIRVATPLETWVDQAAKLR